MKNLVSRALLLICCGISIQTAAFNDCSTDDSKVDDSSLVECAEKNRPMKIAICFCTRQPQKWGKKVKRWTSKEGLSQKVMLRANRERTLEHIAKNSGIPEENQKIFNVALSKNDFQSARALLAYGAQVNGLAGEIPPLHNTTSLHVISFLLENGADPDALDENECTLLEVALDQKVRSWTLIEMLLQFGANPAAKHKDGRSLLDIACSHKQGNVIEHILQYEIELNALNKFGFAPMHYACSTNDPCTIIPLLAHGADPYLKDKKGLQAIEYIDPDNIELTEFIDQKWIELTRQ